MMKARVAGVSYMGYPARCCACSNRLKHGDVLLVMYAERVEVAAHRRCVEAALEEVPQDPKTEKYEQKFRQLKEQAALTGRVF